MKAVALIAAALAVAGVAHFGAALGFLWVLFVGAVFMATWLVWLLWPLISPGDSHDGDTEAQAKGGGRGPRRGG